MARKFYLLMLLVLMACVGCQWRMGPAEEFRQSDEIVIERYDQVEGQYLTMGDYAALNQLKTDYPIQTRTLIENVLKLGPVNDPEINTRWLMFFQDSTLQVLMNDVKQQYYRMDDLNQQFTQAFRRLVKMLPNIPVPHIYSQISSFDQSIVVVDSLLGISLDKYLGSDYPAYLRYGYSEQQRSMMKREYIVPDGLGFFLLSHYPMPEGSDSSNVQKRWHIAKIQYVVNRVLGRQLFANDTIRQIEKMMNDHPQMSVDELLTKHPVP